MKIPKFIINNLLFFELYANTGKLHLKIWRILKKNNGIILVEQPCDIEGDLKRWKHFPAVLLITGDQVVSKMVGRDDFFFKRVTENPELLWDLYPQVDAERETISFLRKEVIEELMELFEKNDIYILKRWISCDDKFSRENLIIDFYNHQLNLSEIHQNLSLINILCLITYYKMRLPILLLFFITLLGNFLLYMHLRQDYETIQSELYFSQQKNKQQQNDRKKQDRILLLYQSTTNQSIALIADRIASYVPKQMVLNSLTIFPLEGAKYNSVSQNKSFNFKKSLIQINGETEISGSISLFTQFLENDYLFSKVKICSLAKDKDSPSFNFELDVELNP